MNDMMNPHALGYVVVTDYLKANTGEDVSDAIQQIINDNPHRTIYFPDGEYILAKPARDAAEKAKMEADTILHSLNVPNWKDAYAKLLSQK